jgi:hypothetical protein
MTQISRELDHLAGRVLAGSVPADQRTDCKGVPLIPNPELAP